MYDTTAMPDGALVNESSTELPQDGVEVQFFAAARSAYGANSAHVEPGSLTDVLQRLVVRAPALAAVLPRCSFLINGYAVTDSSDDGDHMLTAGDRLDVLPPFAGG
jgi:molybdopterin synthase sulfur carrier subunit